MTYEFETNFTLTDTDAGEKFRKPQKIEAVVLFDVDEDADFDGVGWIDRSTPIVRGFRVKCGDEWCDVDGDNPLHNFLELAFVYDREAMLDVYCDAQPARYPEDVL